MTDSRATVLHGRWNWPIGLTPDCRNPIQLGKLRRLAALWRVDAREQAETIAGNAAGESLAGGVRWPRRLAV
ncbi:MAG: hypothetical protein L0228_11395 [Planctomycetes bacterium]|nr:hypothetical protein [Planctomycetota bacterium]